MSSAGLGDEAWATRLGLEWGSALGSPRGSSGDPEKDGEEGWEARRTPDKMKMPKPSCPTSCTKLLSVYAASCGEAGGRAGPKGLAAGSDGQSSAQTLPLTLGETSLCQTFSHNSIPPRGRYNLHSTVQMNTEALRSEVTCPGSQESGRTIPQARIFCLQCHLLSKT